MNWRAVVVEFLSALEQSKVDQSQRAQASRTGLPGDLLMKARKFRSGFDLKADPLGRWIVAAIQQFDGNVHVVARYATREEADFHAAEIMRYPHWRDVRVLDVTALQCRFSFPDHVSDGVSP
jgi:hypothetical protein